MGCPSVDLFFSTSRPPVSDVPRLEPSDKAVDSRADMYCPSHISLLCLGLPVRPSLDLVFVYLFFGSATLTL